MAARKAKKTVAAVVPAGDRRASLEAIRDRLASETDDTLWAKHKRECNCQCGMGDGRLLVALVKELRETIRELDAIPPMVEESTVDRLRAKVTASRDELAAARARRDADAETA